MLRKELRFAELTQHRIDGVESGVDLLSDLMATENKVSS